MKFLDGPLQGLMSYLWLIGTVYLGMHDRIISVGLFTGLIVLFHLYIKASYVFYRVVHGLYVEKKMDPTLMRIFTYMMSEEVRYR